MVRLAPGLTGGSSRSAASVTYLPLSPYSRYEGGAAQNSKNSLDSYDIVSGRKSHLTPLSGQRRGD